MKRPGPTPRPASERFWAKVIFRPSSCWDWSGTHLPTGYSSFAIDGVHMGYAHRYAYETEHGPIPVGYEVDHLCRTPSCVNPAHLEAVTHKENIRRGICSNARKTLCKKGHPYNRVYGKKIRQRFCSICDNARHKARTYKGRKVD